MIFAVSLLAATPAVATEWIYCGDSADKVSIGVLAGSFEFLNISAQTLRVGTEQWSSGETYGRGKPLGIAQAYEDAGQLLLDLSSDGETVAELRVYMADEGENYVQGGVLRVPGRGAWVVSCEGP